ncbi:MAG: hypothetical protein HFACDABA_02970 [Anaerolineales bacterium]|nr:hypothetical protein [Anaerolineales bacterium]
MKKISTLLIAVALALAACKGPASEAPAFPISDAGKTIEVAAGNEFKIVIESNPSTGYHWDLIGELDENILQFVSTEYRADEPVLPGSGGREAWTFQAVAPGEATIVLGYYPPSNDTVEPAQTVTFTIVVK